MGGFNLFILISLFYVFIGLRVARDLWRERKTAFDRNFTPHDRMLVDQAAFFVLVPISVALHEFGHAVAIWSFGGKVVDFGYYIFAGYVSYAENFSPEKELVIAAAGTIVNIIIGVTVIALILLKRPPMRPAINELLLQFAVLQGANALVFYPLLDFATGMNGDWQQMYGGAAGSWRFVVLVVHVGLLAAAYWMTKNPAMRQRIARLTGMPPGVDRGLFGGFGRPAGRRTAQPARPSVAAPAPARRLSLVEERLVEAGSRVASGWSTPITPRLNSSPSASELMMLWGGGRDAARVALLRALPDGSGELWGLIVVQLVNSGTPTHRQLLKRWDALPDENELTFALRLAMEEVNRWPLPAAQYPV